VRLREDEGKRLEAIIGAVYVISKLPRRAVELLHMIGADDIIGRPERRLRGVVEALGRERHVRGKYLEGPARLCPDVAAGAAAVCFGLLSPGAAQAASKTAIASAVVNLLVVFI